MTKKQWRTVIEILIILLLITCSYALKHISKDIPPESLPTTEYHETSASTAASSATTQVTSPTQQQAATSNGMAALYADASAIDVSTLSPDTYAIVLNNNQPYFTNSEISIEAYEYYSPLDSLGRCGPAMACLSTELQPADNEARGSISSIKPSGWHSYQDDNINGGWLYNRSHLIGWQLTAENANECNLITGTRQFNVDGMLPQEMAVDDVLYFYPGLHIMYRVTPIYTDDNLVANGVVMEAFSVEDNGSAITFCMFVPNIQSGWTINYATGEASPI